MVKRAELKFLAETGKVEAISRARNKETTHISIAFGMVIYVVENIQMNTLENEGVLWKKKHAGQCLFVQLVDRHHQSDPSDRSKSVRYLPIDD